MKNNIDAIVRRLGVLQKEKLNANNHRTGWASCPPSWLLSRLKQEVGELESALINQSPEDAVYECADVANFAAMIVDVLESRAALQEEGK